MLVTVAAGSAALLLYTYLGYPLLLWCLARAGRRRRAAPARPPEDWPLVSICVPVHNEAAQIRGLLDTLLAVDYPPDRRQVVVVSDASTDGTDEIVREYAERGVELVRLSRRGGKTAAENAARPYLRGEIVVNTDASVRLHPGAVRALVARFADPAVGVASGRDVSVARAGADANAGEAGYVGYEMRVRGLETRAGGIVGASGCLYAVRSTLHGVLMPEALSRDFAAPLLARERGYRSVSVHEAVCFVPRAGSLRHEYRRKVRTFTRGMETLYFKRALLNPFRYGRFAWMLFSHKVCRWAVPWALAAVVALLPLAALEAAWARGAVGIVGSALALAAVGWWWPQGRRVPRLAALAAYAVAGNVAVLHAWVRALRGEREPVWEPTRRETFEAR